MKKLKILKWFVWLGLAGLVFISGVVFQRYVGAREALAAVGIVRSAHAPVKPAQAVQSIPLNTLQGQRILVLLAAGQSNAANFVNARAQGGPGVYSFFKGKLYPAADPLPGATGLRGSVWTRLGPLLKSREDVDAVVFASVAVGSTQLAQWVPGGSLNKRLIAVIHNIQAAGLPVSALLWHQGESDAAEGTTREAYEAGLQALVKNVRGAGTFPIFISTATYCFGKTSAAVQAAQMGIVSPHHQVYAGPNTDALVAPRYRYDNCHFSAQGAQITAQLWAEVLEPIQPIQI